MVTCCRGEFSGGTYYDVEWRIWGVHIGGGGVGVSTIWMKIILLKSQYFGECHVPYEEGLMGKRGRRNSHTFKPHLLEMQGDNGINFYIQCCISANLSIIYINQGYPMNKFTKYIASVMTNV